MAEASGGRLPDAYGPGDIVRRIARPRRRHPDDIDPPAHADARAVRRSAEVSADPPIEREFVFRPTRTG